MDVQLYGSVWEAKALYLHYTQIGRVYTHIIYISVALIIEILRHYCTCDMLRHENTCMQCIHSVQFLSLYPPFHT